jgi:DNA-binding XRE family transcriptional regulator
MTQAVLAEKTHTALRTIIAIENNQRYPTYEVFYKIICALDISADQIFWPENVTYTAEQEQVIREFLNCSEREQSVIMKTVRALCVRCGKKAGHKCRHAIGRVLNRPLSAVRFGPTWLEVRTQRKSRQLRIFPRVIGSTSWRLSRVSVFNKDDAFISCRDSVTLRAL